MNPSWSWSDRDLHRFCLQFATEHRGSWHSSGGSHLLGLESVVYKLGTVFAEAPRPRMGSASALPLWFLLPATPKRHPESACLGSRQFCTVAHEDELKGCRCNIRIARRYKQLSSITPTVELYALALVGEDATTTPEQVVGYASQTFDYTIRLHQKFLISRHRVGGTIGHG